MRDTRLAYFSDEEKLTCVKTIVGPPSIYGLDEQTVAVLRAIAADYETKAAGIEPDAGFDATDRAVLPRLMRKAADQIEDDDTKAVADGFTPLISSNLFAVKHNPRLNELIVRFRNGTTYMYKGVDREIYSRIVIADSPGGTFAKLVVKGDFAFEKLENWK